MKLIVVPVAVLMSKPAILSAVTSTRFTVSKAFAFCTKTIPLPGV